MSKKKKKQKAEYRQAIKQEIPIQDDPYWKVSSIYMDMHRLGRFFSRLERFEDRHPEWVDDLMDGIPTYYCVLGIERGATEDEIKQAYEKKSYFSSYSDETIDEAFDVLSNSRLQKEYDELLSIFEQITKSMPLPERNELIETHSAHISAEKEFIRMGQLLAKYKDYNILYMLGMPDLYEISGIPADSTSDEIREYCKMDSELLNKICIILGDPASREDYNFMIYFISKYTSKEILDIREKRKKKWENIDKGIREKIVLIALEGPDSIERYMARWEQILNSNQDWRQYLPPNTFLSILGLDKNSLYGDKKEIERIIREKYRNLEKTVQVNLAYSVIKNSSQREDYLWLLENYKILDTLDNLFKEREGKKIQEEKYKTPSAQEILDAVANLFAEEGKAPGGTKRGEHKIPSTEEMLNILAELLEEGEKAPKRAKRGSRSVKNTFEE